MQTRRDFLKLAAMTSAAAGLVPQAIQRAYAIAPTPGSTFLDAEHVVILMQENRSFDHTFGTLQGVRGFNDPRAIRLPNGNSVFVQSDAAGNTYAPWRLDIKDTRITWMGSLPHSRESQVDAWNEGRHDGWLDAKRPDAEHAELPLTMGHYTREDLPFYYALADAFTVCDQNYCSVMTSTSPNRSFFWTGTIRDTQSRDGKVYIRNEQIDGGGLTWKTFPERLHEAGISWKSYQNELTRSGLSGDEDAWLSNFSDNILECFAAYNVEAYPGYVPAAQQMVSELSVQAAKLTTGIAEQRDTATAARLRSELDEIHTRIRSIEASIAKSGDARYQQLSQSERALHHAAFTTNSRDADYHDLLPLTFEDKEDPQTMRVPKGDVLYQFRQDVSEGKLPTISWLTAPEKFSDHPTSPWYGAWYVSEVMDILTKNPEVWKKTIFILTYDENDGYFDHAPSFVAADPKRPETGGASTGIDTGLEYAYKEDELGQGVKETEARSGPIGMGFRVPMVIASPWSRGGWVNSQLFDHTSTLMFLEHFVMAKSGKTVHEENISPWRRAISGDLTSVFRTYDPKEPDLSPLERDKFVVSIEKARFKEVPSNYKRLTPEEIAQINLAPSGSELFPRQERGIRPACALPYELYADGNLNEDGIHFDLHLIASDKTFGAKSAGAPFNVYLRNLKTGNASNGGIMSATYAVRPGAALTRKVPLSLFVNSSYEIEVYGPNGFYRSFNGTAHSVSLLVRTNYGRHGNTLAPTMQVTLANKSIAQAEFIIKDNVYQSERVTGKIAPGHEASVAMHFKCNHGWYDFTITRDGSSGTMRYAGHIETGQPSFSDPFMGGLSQHATPSGLKERHAILI